jgi:hypothetical protein
VTTPDGFHQHKQILNLLYTTIAITGVTLVIVVLAVIGLIDLAS